MANKYIYKVTVLNWEIYNSQHKKSYKKMMIPNNFAQDAKLRVLPVTHRWMWLELLLTCSDHARDTVEYSERQLRAMLESSKSIDRALDSLQSLQLLKYIKNALIEEKRIERKEEKRIELPTVSKKPKKEIQKVDGLNFVIAKFCELWKLKYKANAVIKGANGRHLKTFTKTHGVENSLKYIEGYFKMNDHWFLTRTHDAATLASNVGKIVSFLETNKVLTRKEINNLDSMNTIKNQLEAVDKGEI